MLIFVLAEDTRVSGKLLKNYEIKTKMISYNSHSKEHVKENIFSLLKDGKNLALISDAGTPTISDPGMKIVEQIYEEFPEEIKNGEIKIEPIPGGGFGSYFGSFGFWIYRFGIYFLWFLTT